MPDILEIRERPRLRRRLVIAGFGGWGNAGAAATGAIEYLLGEPRPEPCAVADAERCFDFTVARPVTTRGGADGWKLILPTLACYAVPRPHANRDLLLVLGPEPHFQWPTLARALATFFGGCGADLAVFLGGFLGGVSHRRGDVVRRTLHPPLDVALAELGVGDTGYEGPTAFQTMLVHAAHEQGIPATSIWVAAPPYVQGPSPRAALALLDTVERLAGIDLGLGRLRARAADWVRQLDQAIASNPALAAQLGQVVNLEDPPAGAAAEPRPEPPAKPEEELPSGEAMVEELERYLRRLRGPQEGEQP